MSLVDRIRICNRRDMTHFRPFLIDDARVGWVKHAFAERLADFPAVFTVGGDSVRLAANLDSFEIRSRAVQDVLDRLRSEGMFDGWRGEEYPISTAFPEKPLMTMERAAVAAFGVRTYGIHVNGYVETEEGLRLWVARRAKDKATAPGKLDHLVAGGQPFGISLRDNLVKEGAEEASLPEPVMRTAQSVGVFAYRMETEEGLRDDLIFNYDLRLPADFTPRNTDGEIDEFFLWPIEQVRRVMAETEDFKFNVAPVNIDFLVRHGILAPEDPDYLEILAALHASGV
ncbi:DUF4743 domain-containing protein [Rhodospirillaceae bacterium SYSU D60014]|uniref:DUF4743 domain-containing protein n=1 Tax=Virgifigura deserti TaxID=2268457 RepID=UPI000E67602A